MRDDAVTWQSTMLVAYTDCLQTEQLALSASVAMVILIHL